ncbi:MAG TPA: exonuclease domain-containing protein, partial [Holophagaceae bacterium]|nr:exonuclease domain-containing protein [Holophagaceae bacterium]
RLLARKLVPEVQQRGLANLCEFFGIVNQRHHRALQDAEATAELLQRLLERAEAKELDAEAFLKIGEVHWKQL